MKTLKIFLVVMIIIFLAIFLTTTALSKKKVWVAGEYGYVCYDEFKYHKNIKLFHYFESREECLQFINR